MIALKRVKGGGSILSSLRSTSRCKTSPTDLANPEKGTTTPPPPSRRHTYTYIPEAEQNPRQPFYHHLSTFSCFLPGADFYLSPPLNPDDNNERPRFSRQRTPRHTRPPDSPAPHGQTRGLHEKRSLVIHPPFQSRPSCAAWRKLSCSRRPWSEPLLRGSTRRSRVSSSQSLSSSIVNPNSH